jgi:hypothetical protein
MKGIFVFNGAAMPLFFITAGPVVGCLLLFKEGDKKHAVLL